MAVFEPGTRLIEHDDIGPQCRPHEDSEVVPGHIEVCITDHVLCAISFIELDGERIPWAQPVSSAKGSTQSMNGLPV
ncbi:hypothetical protein [Nocardia tengchongensis]|uniref:hypothetical protein n=1 Tax=Nocardia tengchongensis TaxID=2055889 RepID=UPI0036B79A3A